MTEGLYPCPCCGRLVFPDPPGSYEICPICFWEDDVIQLRWPDWAGGANRPSLRESQLTFARLGAMEERFLRNVRPPEADEQVDDGWHAIGADQDLFEPTGVQEHPWPDDYTALYWWRPSFWRRR